jgi:glycosyltransferase involved in cell wall biosynthesis
MMCGRTVHVALNLAFLTPGEMGGLEVYARRVTEALAVRDDVRLTMLLPRGQARDWAEFGEVIALRLDPRRRTQWVLGDQLHAPRSAARTGADVLHSLASTGPLTGRVPRVVTVHDLNYLMFPEAHFGLRARGMRLLVPAAARRSRRVMVSSEATRDDLVRHLGLATDKIDVVPLALGHSPAAPTRTREQTRADLGAGTRQILLTVSAKRPHKNLMRLLGALARIAPERRPLLVMPGYATPHEDELRACAKHLDVPVELMGWVSDEELENLYRAADAFVFPSLHEGFGMPVLEAMARGVPVAASGRTSLAEVAGQAALLFDAEDEGSMAHAIERLLTDRDLAARLAAAGPEQAARFNWDRTAELAVASYRRALDP